MSKIKCGIENNQPNFFEIDSRNLFGFSRWKPRCPSGKFLRVKIDGIFTRRFTCTRRFKVPRKMNRKIKGSSSMKDSLIKCSGLASEKMTWNVFLMQKIWNRAQVFIKNNKLLCHNNNVMKYSCHSVLLQFPSAKLLPRHQSNGPLAFIFCGRGKCTVVITDHICCRLR